MELSTGMDIWRVRLTLSLAVLALTACFMGAIPRPATAAPPTELGARVEHKSCPPAGPCSFLTVTTGAGFLFGPGRFLPLGDVSVGGTLFPAAAGRSAKHVPVLSARASLKHVLIPLALGGELGGGVAHRHGRSAFVFHAGVVGAGSWALPVWGIGPYVSFNIMGTRNDKAYAGVEIRAQAYIGPGYPQVLVIPFPSVNFVFMRL